ncbi:hypothetical protein PH210_06485 [Paenibacillus sp. BSR1-1]|uniref:hypothetical protein n=1 Tax=Paenibacillus sp. BSR1-1 TaxID=3020845 RepID=UPI0025AFFC5A|nr:hypothetical protein [Paenibacillus sp. BSR1-1]MDN3015854.1 hypothetical protein [Paenibacillus sp. BSR1-1]
MIRKLMAFFIFAGFLLTGALHTDGQPPPDPVEMGKKEGFYEGIRSGLEDRHNFRISRAWQQVPTSQLSLDNKKEIARPLMKIGLLRQVSLFFSSEEKFNAYLHAHPELNAVQAAERILGQRFVRAYKSSFQKGYEKSLTASPEKAANYAALLKTKNK